jgi:mannan endo-1,4-beta-mannosidase
MNDRLWLREGGASKETSPALPVRSESGASQQRQWAGLTINWRPNRSIQQELSVTEPQTGLTARRGRHRTAIWVSIAACAVLVIGAAVPVALHMRSAQPTNSAQPTPYLGVYEQGTPSSYAGITAFTTATRVTPDVLMYYSSWLEPFQTSFATTAAEHGAVPLVQINPYGVSLAAIASGQYDGYLSGYAEAVHSYPYRVILSFGHEMNGHWYPWGNTHTSPAVFVAAWRHIVTLFRRLGVRNVTWLWTVNIMDTLGGIPSPTQWWPGSSYVNWVGLDGYYYESSWTFASLFGPTIATVRALTHDPILIAETGAAVDQPAKIADLFSGIHLYGLLGFVWFDAKADEDWRLTRPAAIAAFRQGAKTYHGLTS